MGNEIGPEVREEEKYTSQAFIIHVCFNLKPEKY